jgi:ABC-type branched-subunit amino acid transport system permease subunit
MCFIKEVLLFIGGMYSTIGPYCGATTFLQEKKISKRKKK